MECKKFVPCSFGLKVVDSSIAKNDRVHWEKIDLNTFDYKKPIYLCFGGIGTVSDKDASYVGGGSI